MLSFSYSEPVMVRLISEQKDYQSSLEELLVDLSRAGAAGEEDGPAMMLMQISQL
jgi:hypothetical protein